MKWSSPYRRSRRLGLLFAVFLLAVPGCGAHIQSGQVAPFRTGVATVSQQAQQSFAEVNATVRATEVDVAATADALKESNFAAALPADATAKWSRAFADIEAYAGVLQELLSDEQRKGIEEQIQNVGLQLQKRTDQELPAGLAAAFQSFGGFLVKAYAEHKALQIVADADPYVQDIFRSLAEAVGPTNAIGLRGQVRSAWNTRLSTLEGEFRTVALDKGRNTSQQKRQLAAQYAAMLDLHDQQDLALVSLRGSLLALADAHAALAKGEQLSAASLIQTVRDEYQQFREAKAQYEELRNQAHQQEKKS